MKRYLIWPYARALFVLPGTVLIFLPAAIFWFGQGTHWGGKLPQLEEELPWLGYISFLIGLFLAGWTNRLFLTIGDGTPAPWDPPRNFVLQGPFLYVRNPMMLAVFLLLLGEALVFRSLGVFLWLVVFILLNLIYIPFSEEKGLAGRFGKDYEEYCREVPRWWPRLNPWIIIK